MYGDSNGSPRRDDLPETDIKVAGGPRQDWAQEEIAYGRSAGGGTFPVKIVAFASTAAVVLAGTVVAALSMTGGSNGKKTVTAAVSPSQQVAADPSAQTQPDAARMQAMLDRASQAARSDSGSGTGLVLKGTTPSPRPSPSPSKSGSSNNNNNGGSLGPATPIGTAQHIALSMLSSFGFASSQFSCLQQMWNRESGWNTHAANPNGAYGIPQAYPGNKMASFGADWRNSASIQIRWGLTYIKGRYGTPCAAWSHWQSAGSY
ncbi:MAG TPA: lytic transglycosylase domain-containing protein [Streptosporangiaceae bacterium]|nr:lytic transglycosylase domain-containing protein [Streptosporangiaceae bacterium]